MNPDTRKTPGRPGRKLRVTLVQVDGTPVCVPLGLGCLKCYAESLPGLKAATDISIVQVPAVPRCGMNAAVRKILENAPDMVGFSCFLWNIRDVERLCKKIRKDSPRIIIILGGPEAGTMPEEVLSRIPADFVACGEGEETFAELLDSCIRGAPARGIRGLAQRAGAGVIVNPPRERMRDPDRIPSPYLEGALPLEGNLILLETSRGCPFRCAFCTWCNNTPTRYFSLARVAAELACIAAMTPEREIWVVDSDPCRDRKRGLEILGLFGRVLGRTGWRVRIESCLGSWDRKMIRQMKRFKGTVKSGVQTINMPLYRTLGRFPPALAGLERNIRYFRSEVSRSECAVDIIFGLPGDTLEGFERTLDWAVSVSPDYITAFRCLILPGSDYWRRRGKLRIASESRPPYRLISSPGFPAKDIRKAAGILLALKRVCGDAFLKDRMFKTASGMKNKRGARRLPYVAALKKIAGPLKPGKDTVAADSRLTVVIARGD